MVADIGAGSGYMTVRMARRVGANGIVYANDIQQPMLDLLDKRLKKAKIANVRPILGTPDDPRLPPESVEMALLVDVYHEFPSRRRCSGTCTRVEDRRPAGAARVPARKIPRFRFARNTK